jgi:hypothetical protein
MVADAVKRAFPNAIRIRVDLQTIRWTDPVKQERYIYLTPAQAQQYIIAFDAGDPQPSGKTFRLTGSLRQGIDSENAKKITKLIRDDGPKSVKTQIQGEEVRVTSKNRDDLQAVIALLKGADLEVALQFVNYR